MATTDATGRGPVPVTSESKRRVRLADGQRKGFETAWNEYFDCYGTTTYLEAPLIRLEDISYHLYLKKNINPTNPRWELPSFRQLKKTLGLSQDKIQGIEARLGEAGLLLKESGKGKGAKGENVANDYLLYEPLELAEFLLAVAGGRLPGTLNEKGQRRLRELRDRFDECEVRNAECGVAAPSAATPQQAAAPAPKPMPHPAFRAPHSPVPEIGTPVRPGGVPENRTPVVPLFGAAGVPGGAPRSVPESGTQNRPPVTDLIQQTSEQQQETRRGTATRSTQAVAEAADRPDAESVVVADQDDLVERGITVGVARRLRRTIDPATIARQVEIFDALREADPADPKLTPGRLRRQIEEDWSAPAGFVPAAERAAAAAAQAERAARDEVARREQLTAQAAATANAQESRRAELQALGLNGADQATWARIAQANPPLPPPFRDALFHAPGSDGAGALIFRDRAAWTRATGPAHATARARIVARVADICGRPGAQVHYLIYEDVVRLLANGE